MGDLRPLLVGDALRRVFSKCVLLQEGKGIGERLARTGQFGCGFRCGTEAIYHLAARTLGALAAKGIPCASCESDAKNAHGPTRRSAIQRGAAKWKPLLLKHFDFLYGPHVRASAYFYGAGAPAPAGPCALPCGVHQGDVLGPLFFSLGPDELLGQSREQKARVQLAASMGDFLVDGQQSHVSTT